MVTKLTPNRECFRYVILSLFLMAVACECIIYVGFPSATAASVGSAQHDGNDRAMFRR